MPVVSIRHQTTYRYRKPVAFGEHRVLYRPIESHDQRLISAALAVTPDPALLRHVHDVSGATVAVTRFDERADTLTFESRVSVLHLPGAPFELENEESWLTAAAGIAYHPDEAPELGRCIVRRHPDDGATEDWAHRFLKAAGRTRVSEALADMTHAIREGFAYRLRLEGGPQTPEATLARRSGSCRDFALLMVEAARSLGLAARFVTGYVYSGGSGGGRTGGGHTHAWAQVYVPGCGWVDFDPTNGIVGNTDLIRVACVADPRLAIPLYGVWDGDRTDFLDFDVDVEVIVEAQTSQPQGHSRVGRGH